MEKTPSPLMQRTLARRDAQQKQHQDRSQIVQEGLEIMEPYLERAMKVVMDFHDTNAKLKDDTGRLRVSSRDFLEVFNPIIDEGQAQIQQQFEAAGMTGSKFHEASASGIASTVGAVLDNLTDQSRTFVLRIEDPQSKKRLADAQAVLARADGSMTEGQALVLAREIIQSEANNPVAQQRWIDKSQRATRSRPIWPTSRRLESSESKKRKASRPAV